MDPLLSLQGMQDSPDKHSWSQPHPCAGKCLEATWTFRESVDASDEMDERKIWKCCSGLLSDKAKVLINVIIWY